MNIRPIQQRDFDTVAALARAIWFAHYITIITRDQIEYMLRGRFTPENLGQYLDSNERWMDVLECEGKLVGYCSYALTSKPTELKLEQLYLLPELHGQGMGREMLMHVERFARDHGGQSLMLTVNKLNEKAIRVYQRAGFKVREEVVIDIGNGFVMDDYVMAKSLTP